MKLSVVIPVLNNRELFISTFGLMKSQQAGDMEYIIIDNGSIPVLRIEEEEGVKIIRNDCCVGVYPTFKQGMENATGDIVAFFHNDLAIWEYAWDERILNTFKEKEKLGLLGFIGSNEISNDGGRGFGTTSNFMGKTWDRWVGSHAVAHGEVSLEYSNAAVVDGCAMIIRREAWNDIGYRTDWPIHHFYDRLISCQMLEKNWQVGVLGIACDHFSGQTANSDMTYFNAAMKWCTEHNIPLNLNGWDSTIYKEAERMFLKEYRDVKHLVPIVVEN